MQDARCKSKMQRSDAASVKFAVIVRQDTAGKQATFVAHALTNHHYTPRKAHVAKRPSRSIINNGPLLVKLNGGTGSDNIYGS